jgi:hypothetical protein
MNVEEPRYRTAVKRMPNVKPKSALLPDQAIIQPKDTWISEQGGLLGDMDKDSGSKD